MKLILSIIVLTFFLAGCRPIDREQVTVYLTRCPPLVSYSKETQKKALAELRKIASDSEIARMISDYSKLRDACRINNKM